MVTTSGTTTDSNFVSRYPTVLTFQWRLILLPPSWPLLVSVLADYSRIIFRAAIIDCLGWGVICRGLLDIGVTPGVFHLWIAPTMTLRGTAPGPLLSWEWRDHLFWILSLTNCPHNGPGPFLEGSVLGAQFKVTVKDTGYAQSQHISSQQRSELKWHRNIFDVVHSSTGNLFIFDVGIHLKWYKG